jgi:dTDP-4-amino-4,6-dideoxygalactose transaminase
MSMNYSSGDFPVTENAAGEIVSLPMFPQLTASQQSQVANEVLAFTSQAKGKAGDEGTPWQIEKAIV